MNANDKRISGEKEVFRLRFACDQDACDGVGVGNGWDAFPVCSEEKEMRRHLRRTKEEDAEMPAEARLNGTKRNHEFFFPLSKDNALFFLSFLPNVEKGKKKKI